MDTEPSKTLADQAAEWVPPWARRAAPAAEPAADPVPEPVAEPAADPVPEPEPGSGSGEDLAVGEVAAAEAGVGEADVESDDAGEAEAGAVPPERMRGAVEAILLVVDEPVAETMIAQILDQGVDRITAVLRELAAEYTAQGRGFELRRAAGGWRLYTRAEYAGYVERFVLDGQRVRLTQAALETLAVVAYKQPATRSRISAIRGVNCDGVVRTLVSRGLIEECGTEPETGAFLYRTTTLFLEKLGLDSVHHLPPLAPFLPDDVEEVVDAQR